MRARRVGLVALLGSVLVVAGCAGQGEKEKAGGEEGFKPSRNVVMIVPFEPGGGSDVLGRAMAAGLEKARPDANISVENRAGGGGAVGNSYLLEQKGDPHFVLASETSGVSIPLTAKVPWRYTDFTPIGQIAEDATLMVVPEDSEFKTLPDVIEAAKSERLKVAITGPTSLDAIVVGLTEQDQDVKFERVVFESGGEIVNALLGGDIDLAMLNPSEVIGQLEANKARATNVFAEQRYKGGDLADVPTAKEEGIDVSFVQYRGMFAAGGIKPDERAYWTDALTEWTKSPEYKEYIDKNYLIPKLTAGKAFEDYLKEYETTLKPVLEK